MGFIDFRQVYFFLDFTFFNLFRSFLYSLTTKTATWNEIFFKPKNLRSKKFEHI